MNSPDDLRQPLQHMLSGLAQHAGAHLTEIEADLLQTGYLLSEAIEKLSRSFLGIHDNVAAQQVLMASLLAGEVATPEVQAQVTRLQQQVAEQVNAAITGLQFQDMTSQLIGRSIGHVGNLRDLLDGLEHAGAGLADDADSVAPAAGETTSGEAALGGSAPAGPAPGESAPASRQAAACSSSERSVLAVLVAINRLLDEKSAALRNVARKAVAQTHMESGEIDLF